ncbi:MAG: MFS transporter [Pseudomonadales bacterium]|nr:MFS transporter [Pseudomonadales bacterium]
MKGLHNPFGRPPLPAVAERAFRYEQLTELTLPVAFTLLEGGIVGVIAAKIYHVSPMVLAVITAAPMFGNLSSFFWSRIANARGKVRVTTTVQVLTVLCVVAIALTPVSQTGTALLVLGMVLSRLLIAGITTVRSVVWSLNYARAVRARTTGRLQIITSLVTVVISSLVGPLLDADPGSFRWVYGAGALFGVLGICFFSRVNVIGEARHRVLERRSQRNPTAGETLGFFTILRRDRNFAQYQIYQFIAGSGNMIIEAPLVYLVTRELEASYTASIALTMVIPFALSVVTLPLWANFLDRVHVNEFRARQSVLWIISQLLLWFGAFTSSLLWIAASRLVLGVARGGGSLAWQLGHNDFAEPKALSAYMGIHVTLTGVRGAIMPFLGMLLYLGAAGLNDSILPGESGGIGDGLFLLAAALSLISWWGFRRLHLRMSA